jgi:soluble lytic murein transglycosylase-like protein
MMAKLGIRNVALFALIGLILLLWWLPFIVHADTMPRDALRYQRDLVRNSREIWGLDAPVAVFAGQIHQESRWRADARNAIGATGLGQFMPATATWISGVYSLGKAQPTNPTWAIRALVTYNLHNWNQLLAANDCSHIAMSLSAYNGGLGWVYRDQKKAGAKGLQPFIWFYQVEKVNAGRAPAMFTENRAYPRAILLRWQQLYASWGGAIIC